MDGELKYKYKLHDSVRAITKDGDFVYAGCNDGGIYDLTHKEPRLMCKIESFSQILSVDVHYGLVTAGDDDGNIALVNYEGEIIWKKKMAGICWMVRMDDAAVYQSSGNHVAAYRVADGKRIWRSTCKSDILYGEHDENYIYVGMADSVQKIAKKTGKIVHTYGRSDLWGIASNDVADDGIALAGGCTSSGFAVACFDGESEETVYLMTVPDSTLSMKYYKGRIYLVGNGGFKCIDMSKKSITDAWKHNKLPDVNQIDVGSGVAAPTIAPIQEVESVNINDVTEYDGIIVRCTKEGGKLRIRPESGGYNKNWNCQFPKDLRKEGARYLVEELRKVPAGQYYRAFGRIRAMD